MTLEKAELYSLDGQQYNFKFMFNPTEISVSKKSKVTENRGARTENQGIPKTSFAHPNASIIKIQNIIIDCYEREKNRDVGEEMKKLTQTVKFIDSEERPPIYLFSWGKINYLRCYVESLDYKLTMFLEDGTPVRAKASITLKEIDPSVSSSNPSSISSERRNVDTRW